MAHLIGSHYRRSPLLQWGLEIPCKLVISLPGTQKNCKLLEKYSELYESVYDKPEEEVGLVTFTAPVDNANKDAPIDFNNHATGNVSSGKRHVSHGELPKSKKKKTTIKCHDIRSLFEKMKEAENDSNKASSSLVQYSSSETEEEEEEFRMRFLLRKLKKGKRNLCMRFRMSHRMSNIFYVAFLYDSRFLYSILSLLSLV